MSVRPAACLDDGALVAVLDGERRGGEAAPGAAAHVAGCGACRERLERLRRRDAAVRSWIESHDPEPPPREAYDLSPRATEVPRWSRGWVAAAAVVLVSAGVLVSPARGLILDGLRHWIGELGVLDRGPEVTAPVAPGGQTGASPGTAFVHRGAELTVTFESAATVGRLTVAPAGDSLVTLRTPGVEIDLTVRPGRVDVVNGTAPRGDYRLEVPPTVARVRLRVRGGGEAVTVVEGLSGPRELALPGASPSRGGSP